MAVYLRLALPQKSSFMGFGFASCCEAWLCPAVNELRFQLGYALKRLHWKHIEAKPKINYRSHTAGQSHASQQLAKPNPRTFEAKHLTCFAITPSGYRNPQRHFL